MRISSDAEVLQIADGFISAVRRDDSLLCKSPQYLSHLKIKQMGSVQRLVT